MKTNKLKCLVVIFSFHHKNTEKINEIFTKVFDAPIRTPKQINPDELQNYDLIGFDSGLYDEKHHKILLHLADRLHQVTNKNMFIFSTSGYTRKREVAKAHSHLQKKLQSKD